LLAKYLKDKKFNIKDDLYNIEHVGNHITLRHSHHGNDATTVMSINDMQLEFSHSCRPVDLHHPDSFPEIVKTFCRRHWSVFPGKENLRAP
jgi:hypothetical protein